MKNKKLTLIIGSLLLIGIVTAVAIGEIKDVQITKEDIQDQRFEGNITFDVDGRPHDCWISEPYEHDLTDEAERCISNYKGTITNIVDWQGRRLKEVTIDDKTYRSFDEQKLEKIKEEREPTKDTEVKDEDTDPII